jgi:hypothetical protein
MGVERAAGAVGHVAGEDVGPVDLQLDGERDPAAGAERAGEGDVTTTQGVWRCDSVVLLVNL